MSKVVREYAGYVVVGKAKDGRSYGVKVTKDGEIEFTTVNAEYMTLATPLDAYEVVQALREDSANADYANLDIASFEAVKCTMHVHQIQLTSDVISELAGRHVVAKDIIRKKLKPVEAKLLMDELGCGPLDKILHDASAQSDSLYIMASMSSGASPKYLRNIVRGPSTSNYRDDALLFNTTEAVEDAIGKFSIASPRAVIFVASAQREYSDSINFEGLKLLVAQSAAGKLSQDRLAAIPAASRLVTK